MMLRKHLGQFFLGGMYARLHLGHFVPHIFLLSLSSVKNLLAYAPADHSYGTFMPLRCITISSSFFLVARPIFITLPLSFRCCSAEIYSLSSFVFNCFDQKSIRRFPISKNSQPDMFAFCSFSRAVR